MARSVGINFVECLQLEIAFIILSLLEDPADIIRVCTVSHSWRRFVIDNRICKNLFLKRTPQASNIDNVIIQDKDNVLRIDNRSGFPLSYKLLEKEHAMYVYLFRAWSESLIYTKGCLDCFIGGSITIYYSNGRIVRNLAVDFQDGSFWSSLESRDPNEHDSILIKLNGGVCIVTEILVPPFEAFVGRYPVYSSLSVRFRMGQLKSVKDLMVNLPTEDEVDLQTLSERNLDDNIYLWTYTSPEFPMAGVSSMQSFKLPEPVFCIGGYLKIELLGRAQMQEGDDALHYESECFEVRGHSLEPAFDIQTDMDEGKAITLEYRPDFVKSVFDYIHEECNFMETHRLRAVLL